MGSFGGTLRKADRAATAKPLPRAELPKAEQTIFDDLLKYHQIIDEFCRPIIVRLYGDASGQLRNCEFGSVCTYACMHA